MNKGILLKSRPVGRPQISDFEFITEDMPIAETGEIILKTIYVSVDPYLRGRMSDAKSYIPPFQLEKPVQSGIVAEVLESKNNKFLKGDFVAGSLDWKTFQKSNGAGLLKIKPSEVPLSAYQGILGMTGLTAYFGLTEIGKPKSGETIVVSGAAGAVGMVVGQIGKIFGCRVVGIVGSDEKVELLKTKFKFDDAINYKTTPNIYKSIAKSCPDGIDIYFDNVGGEISDAVLSLINKFARVIICGAIANYNDTELPVGPRVQSKLLVKSALMQGFIVSDFSNKIPQAIVQLTNWFQEGKIINQETIVEGFENIPQARSEERRV